MVKKGKMTKGAKAPTAGVELKRGRTTKGVVSVVGGRNVFDENGKLRPPAKFVADGDGGIDVILKKNEAQEHLRPVDAKYQKLMDVEFCKVQSVRDTLIKVTDELEKIPGVYLKNYDGYMSVGFAEGNTKRHLITINPLKRGWRVQVDRTTKGWTVEKVVAKVHELIKQFKTETSTEKGE